nr:helix-turn-helix domain-containing protein [uncultured Brevundimonas sp.]
MTDIALSPAASAPVVGSAADPTDIAIGARIRARREALRITQAQLAAGAGVTFQQVQKYERGVNRIASARLLRIAALLKTTGADLLGELEMGEVNARALVHPDASQLLDSFHALPQDRRDALLTIAKGMVH